MGFEIQTATTVLLYPGEVLNTYNNTMVDNEPIQTPDVPGKHCPVSVVEARRTVEISSPGDLSALRSSVSTSDVGGRTDARRRSVHRTKRGRGDCGSGTPGRNVTEFGTQFTAHS